MVESPRDPDPNAPQNPPGSVVNNDVRRSALWTYLGTIVVFFVGVALVLAYWVFPLQRDRDPVEPRVQGTTGTEGEGSRSPTPGGHDPYNTPARPEDEIAQRGGRAITELGEVFEDNSRDVIGRRIELVDIDVERVDSPALFWIRDGNARIAVTTGGTGASVRPGQSVNVVGMVERSGGDVRIRASRIEPSQ